MRTPLIIGLFLVSSIYHSQNLVKSKEDYTAINGDVFKVGQTIVLGSPGDFSNDFIYYTQGVSFERESATGTLKIGNQYQQYDFRYKPRVIKHFKVHPELGTFAVVDRVFNEMIHIDNALKTRELMSTEHRTALIHSSKHMNDSIAYIRMLLMEDSITEDHVKEFSYLFNNVKYRQVREDEFEFHKFLISEKTNLEQLMEGLDPKDSLKLIVQLELGNYDFERKGFPVLWNNRLTTRVLDDNWEFLTPEDINKNKVELTDLMVEFINANDFDFLSLNEEKANLFVKYRKSTSGDVNRRVTLFVHFTLQDLYRVDKEEYFTKFIRDEKVMTAKIFRICVFEDELGFNWLNNIVE